MGGPKRVVKAGSKTVLVLWVIQIQPAQISLGEIQKNTHWLQQFSWLIYSCILFCNCFHNFDVQKPFRNANQFLSSFLPIPSSFFSPSIPVNPSYFPFYSKLFILFLNTRPPASSLSRFIHCSLSISLALTIHHCKSCKSWWNCRLIHSTDIQVYCALTVNQTTVCEIEGHALICSHTVRPPNAVDGGLEYFVGHSVPI